MMIAFIVLTVLIIAWLLRVFGLGWQLKRVLSSKGAVLLCGTCMDARGISDTELMEGVRRSTMDELANATAEAEKVLVF